jgi:hypothetical protein
MGIARKACDICMYIQLSIDILCNPSSLPVSSRGQHRPYLVIKMKTMWHYMIKGIFLAACSIATALPMNAQCSASAGEDQHVCVSATGPIAQLIGGTPTAQGGTPPFTYTWSTEPLALYPGSSIILHASDLLNDTTASNPVVTGGMELGEITFHVQITDATGCTSMDSCKVGFSLFYHHLMYYGWGILQGDSIFLDNGTNVWGGVGPLTYLWQPSHGLSDTTLFTGFWAKPDSSIAYYVTVTDSMGCSSMGSPLYFINVHPVGVLDASMQRSIELVYDRTHDVIRLVRPEGIVVTSVHLYNANGNVVLQKDGNVDVIDIRGIARGMYVLVVFSDQGRSSFKVVKN